MSIVGTRPPLISETNLYELHHKARLIYWLDYIIYDRFFQAKDVHIWNITLK